MPSTLLPLLESDKSPWRHAPMPLQSPSASPSASLSAASAAAPLPLISSDDSYHSDHSESCHSGDSGTLNQRRHRCHNQHQHAGSSCAAQDCEQCHQPQHVTCPCKYPQASCEHVDMIRIKVPFTLAEGYTFWATDGRASFPVVVPPGGVEADQYITTPVCDTCRISHTGRWKSGLCQFGMCDTTSIRAWLCPQLLLGQLLTKMNMNWLLIAAKQEHHRPRRVHRSGEGRSQAMVDRLMKILILFSVFDLIQTSRHQFLSPDRGFGAPSVPSSQWDQPPSIWGELYSDATPQQQQNVESATMHFDLQQQHLPPPGKPMASDTSDPSMRHSQTEERRQRRRIQQAAGTQQATIDVNFPSLSWPQLLYLLLSLPLSLYGILVVVRLRRFIRLKYGIPTGCCGSFEDWFLVLFCNCCAMTQMANQVFLADDDNHGDDDDHDGADALKRNDDDDTVSLSYASSFQSDDSED